MHWNFDETGRPHLASKSMLKCLGCQISVIQSKDNSNVKIKLKDSAREHKTLGVLPKPTGDMSAEAHPMKLKNKRIATNAKTSALTRYQGLTFYRQKWLSAMQYSLLATHLSPEQCATIEAQSNHVFLNVTGFPSSLSSAIVAAPKTGGGIGFRSIKVEQGAFHVGKIIIPHGRKDAGTLCLTLKTAVRWFHLMTGLR